MELSIIIPIYNTPKHKLIRCLSAINKLKGIEFECLLIDDGSDDMTADFCREFVKNDSRYVYIRTKNYGVSSARNKGISEADGDYICFVDSDDEIDPENFMQCVDSMEKKDLIFTDLLLIDGKKKTRWNVVDEPNLSYEILMERLLVDGRLNGPCAKFFRKDFLEKFNIRFNQEMINGEDAVFLLDFLSHRPSMQYIPLISYRYYKETESSNGRFKRDPVKCLDNAEVQSTKLVYCLKQGDFLERRKSELTQHATENYIHSLFGWVLTAVTLRMYSTTVQNKVRELTKKIVVPQNGFHLQYRVQYHLLNSKCDFALVVLAYIRVFYLKLKGLG